MSGEQHQIVGIGMGIAGSCLALSLGADYGAIAIGIGSALGCWLPDIDHDRTKLGRKRKVVTEGLNSLIQTVLTAIIIGGVFLAIMVAKGMIDVGVDSNTLIVAAASAVIILFFKNKLENSDEFKWAAKHRGLMHTLIPLFPLYMLMRVSPFFVWRWFVIGLMVGYVSHLIADCTTTEGCPLFYPFAKFNFRIPVFDTDKKRAVGCWILAVLPNLILIAMKFYF